ncbi:MAG: CaiB/BaiF CoA-transferase family protein [Burkholderiales bacterium]|nr:CaiB/BaiF CoA-transferase family protein [Burkholderiales bacterium]
MSQPLEGIRVLELGNFIAGPFCGMLLGDMGADVIKIERPAKGDQTRAMPPLVNGESASFAALNRNKRSLVLDLKQRQARDIVLALVEKSDVFVENNRPGALEGIGLGAEQVRAVNPKIVYVSASGFGQTGPYRRRAGVNLIVEAFSGTLSVTGAPGEMPMRPGIQTADIFGALFATYAALSGLISVLRDKGGRIADVSLVESSIAAAAWETAGFLATGVVPERLGHQHRLNAPYQLFETADQHYLAIGTPNDELFRRFMSVLGLEQHISDARFATYVLRKQNEPDLLDVVTPAIRARRVDDLEALLVEAGVPCSRVNNYQEVFDHPHVRAREVIVDVMHPRMGPTQAVRNPVLFDQDGPVIRRPAPLLAEHSEEILKELGYGADQIDALSKAGVVLLARQAASGSSSV